MDLGSPILMHNVDPDRNLKSIQNKKLQKNEQTFAITLSKAEIYAMNTLSLKKI